MRIAVIGLGGIGSTFAARLSKAGHDVTGVARGQRLRELQAEGAIVMADGRRVPLAVAPTLDATTEWDLVLVSVLASQVEVVLPQLAASRARSIMFMFNTFLSLDSLSEAVGRDRFAFGFPAVLASVEGGKLTSRIVTSGMLTTVSDARWAEVFNDAGVPSVVHSDMESWLRTHAAFVVPFMAVTNLAHQRQAGISWREAALHARAMSEGFRLVRRMGNEITPTAMAALSKMPETVLATLLWSATRVPTLRQAGAAGPREPRALIDMMVSAAGGDAPALRFIRP